MQIQLIKKKAHKLLIILRSDYDFTIFRHDDFR